MSVKNEVLTMPSMMRWLVLSWAAVVEPLQMMMPATSPRRPSHQLATAIALDQREAKDMSPLGKGLFEEAAKAVGKINAYEKQVEAMTDGELRDRVKELRESDEASLEEIFAISREAGWRVLKQRAYDVQLIGGYVMAKGGLAEMATGEGKTLAAVAPALYAAVSSAEQNALIVTANDYLAARDADGVGQIFRFLGLKVGLIEKDADAEERQLAYSADVVYASNQQVGFDYLRDQLAYAPEDLVLGLTKFGLCLIDEADSILIDEARTPLVISEKKDQQTDAGKQRLKLANDLATTVLLKDVHYEVDQKKGFVALKDEGQNECLNLLQVKNLFKFENNGLAPWGVIITSALKAKETLEKDRDYIVEDGKIELLDTYTGRKLLGRRYADGIQQAVEVKEGLDPSPSTKTAASITFQRLFGFNSPIATNVAAMTGTALTEAKEFSQVYGLETVAIPTNLPVGRKDYPDAVYRTVNGKFNAAVSEIQRSRPRPVLVGTTGVDDSELVAKLLREKFQCDVAVLNARPENAFSESRTVASAGRLGAVTVATNMAGRGTDIVLGGDPKELTRDVVERLLITATMDASEKGTPVPPEAMASDATRTALIAAADQVRQEIFEGEKIDPTDARQVAALVCERQALKGKPSLQALRDAAGLFENELEPQLKEEREKVLEMGGLYVVGTERHESRRIDRQLRGRSGRQGDPGSSRFFVSVEDRIFKVFGGDKLSNLMKTFRIGEDLPIEAKSITDALDEVQTRVEGRNFDIRKSVLDYDDVLDIHRRIIYSERRALLAGDDAVLNEALLSFLLSASEAVVQSVDRDEDDKTKRPALLDQRLTAFFGTLLPGDHPWRKSLVDSAGDKGFLPFLKSDKKDDPHARDFLDSIVLPRVTANRPGASALKSFAQLAILRIDALWADHLEMMKDLQDVVQLQVFAQKNPYNEYQVEARTLFDRLDLKIKSDTIFSLLQLASKPPAQ